ncbi:2-octaprenyl-6-methoxyphenol hydroxylase [Escherichia coli]|nr:2-octaprenyl-6-methoxyphenol hydroxylase [Escherichia coli]
MKRFTQHGPLAMLPMSDGRCSLVWCHPLERREEVLSWSDEKFCRELQSAFGWRLGKITHAGKRSAYPLALTRAARAITHRTVLVAMRRKLCTRLPGKGLTSVCEMS